MSTVNVAKPMTFAGLVKHFRIDFIITAAAIVAAFFYAGAAAIPITAMLILLEMVFSFDNAALNSKYLKKLNAFWRKMFLTVGILIAVFGMRLIFPFIIVEITAGLGPIEAWQLAMEKGAPHTPGTYGYILNEAHPTIAAFGGAFLLMLFLSFIFDAERDSTWIGWLERPLIKAGHFDALPTLVSLAAVVATAEFLAPAGKEFSVLLAGVSGVITFIAVNGLAVFMEARQEAMDASLAQVALLSGKAAFSMFLFLEVLDASFSFDGVLGGFALTSDPILLALGLGVGALYVRSMTIYLVDHDALDEITFMEHGAHYAIGILATLLLFTVHFHIPDWLIGGIGLVVIALSIWWSFEDKKRNPDKYIDPDPTDAAPGIYASYSEGDTAENA